MTKIFQTSAVLTALLAGAAWCTGCAIDSTDSSTEAVTEQGPQSVIIDESDEGGIFDVVEGQRVIVRLPSKPSAGYDWMLVETDKTFGHPTSQEFIADGDGIGGSGVTEFTWETKGALPMLGEHAIRFEYRRAFGQVFDDFTVTVNIIADGQCQEYIEAYRHAVCISLNDPIPPTPAGCEPPPCVCDGAMMCPVACASFSECYGFNEDDMEACIENCSEDFALDLDASYDEAMCIIHTDTSDIVNCEAQLRECRTPGSY